MFVTSRCKYENPSDLAGAKEETCEEDARRWRCEHTFPARDDVCAYTNARNVTTQHHALRNATKLSLSHASPLLSQRRHLASRPWTKEQLLQLQTVSRGWPLGPGSRHKFYRVDPRSNNQPTRRGQAFQPSCSKPRVRGNVTYHVTEHWSRPSSEKIS